MGVFNKKIDDDEKILFYDYFFMTNRNFTTEHVKIAKNFKSF